eukprot:TRINITY_DN55828_c0_g1_i1.p1 TRINITY_DN55828_c0_g1~~TRINITY_DN55828_c0_g1_i1.p1  ORF type:complete len:826 (+),score=201.44 TRINITY_DN55828_c0_g1_i1:109-2478(+)
MPPIADFYEEVNQGWLSCKVVVKAVGHISSLKWLHGADGHIERLLVTGGGGTKFGRGSFLVTANPQFHGWSWGPKALPHSAVITTKVGQLKEPPGVVDSAEVEPGVWHHVVGTMDGVEFWRTNYNQRGPVVWEPLGSYTGCSADRRIRDQKVACLSPSGLICIVSADADNDGNRPLHILRLDPTRDGQGYNVKRIRRMCGHTKEVTDIKVHKFAPREISAHTCNQPLVIASVDAVGVRIWTMFDSAPLRNRLRGEPSGEQVAVEHMNLIMTQPAKHPNPRDDPQQRFMYRHVMFAGGLDDNGGVCMFASLTRCCGGSYLSRYDLQWDPQDETGSFGWHLRCRGGVPIRGWGLGCFRRTAGVIITCAAISNKGDKFAFGTNEGEVVVMNRSGRVLHCSTRLHAPETPIGCVAVAENHGELFVASGCPQGRIVVRKFYASPWPTRLIFRLLWLAFIVAVGHVLVSHLGPTLQCAKAAQPPAAECPVEAWDDPQYHNVSEAVQPRVSAACLQEHGIGKVPRNWLTMFVEYDMPQLHEVHDQGFDQCMKAACTAIACIGLSITLAVRFGGRAMFALFTAVAAGAVSDIILHRLALNVSLGLIQTEGGIAIISAAFFVFYLVHQRAWPKRGYVLAQVTRDMGFRMGSCQFWFMAWVTNFLVVCCSLGGIERGINAGSMTFAAAALSTVQHCAVYQIGLACALRLGGFGVLSQMLLQVLVPVAAAGARAHACLDTVNTHGITAGAAFFYWLHFAGVVWKAGRHLAWPNFCTVLQLAAFTAVIAGNVQIVRLLGVH